MSKAKEIRSKTVSENILISIDCRGWLDEGELLSGTPTIPAVSGITISNNVISIEELTINKKLVPIAQAIQFLVVGGTADTTYDINMSCATDSTPAQNRVGNVDLKVTADTE